MGVGQSAMAGKIFISYRRDDVRDQAARIRDRLATAFGKSNVFMDVDNILPGERFSEKLENELAQTGVLLAIIGPRWGQHIAERQGSTERDYVRDEIAAALKHKIMVIPVLVEGAPLPKPDDLPQEMRGLLQYQTHEITSYKRFSRDVDDLIAAIRTHQKATTPWIGRSLAAIASGAVLLTAILWASTSYWSVPRPGPSPKPTPLSKENLQALAAIAGTGQSFHDERDGHLCPLCPEMVVVPSGSFTMGSPDNERDRYSDEVQIPVAIRNPFAVGRYAVSFAEWDACADDGGCTGERPKDGGWGRGIRPVINISYDDAKSYADWLSRKTGKTYRLLSESEREYVTRAGTTTPYWWGSSISSAQANYRSDKTLAVNSFKPNPWGLYDVHGNVAEWTEDCWGDSNSGNPGDGSARTRGDCSRRVVRGGSWISGAEQLRSAARDRRASVSGYDDVGFRVAKTMVP
jgi:formylglycine-generating enzyme required for sulfatase activity